MIYAWIFCSLVHGNHSITASRFPHKVHYPSIAKLMATEMLLRKTPSISITNRLMRKISHNDDDNDVSLYHSYFKAVYTHLPVLSPLR